MTDRSRSVTARQPGGLTTGAGRSKPDSSLAGATAARSSASARVGARSQNWFATAPCDGVVDVSVSVLFAPPIASNDMTSP